MNNYSQFVSEFSRLLREGRSLPLGGFPPVKGNAPAPDAPEMIDYMKVDAAKIAAAARTLVRA